MWTTIESVPRWHAHAAVGVLASVFVGACAAFTTGEWSRSLALGAMTAFVVVGVVWATIRERPSRRWLLLWPYLLCAGLALLSAEAPAGTALLAGVFVIAFLFVGLTQTPGTFLVVLPAAAASAWTVYDLPPNQALIRLAIATVIWTLVAELPARLLRRLGHHQQYLTHQARTDPLTGLSNRSDLPGHLEHIKSANRTTSMVLIDLDDFKRYNDTHGHMAGDRALAEFGRVIKEVLRLPDRAYRYGGEEFLITFENTALDQAGVAIERLRQRWELSAPGVTFSAGIGLSLEEADAHLYRAKRMGRNQTVHAAD